MIERELTHRLRKMLGIQPAVVLLGPRQVGKTTLARMIAERSKPSVYIDLESPRDLAKMSDPLAFVEAHTQSLLVIDEIHRIPNLFQILRGVIDEGRLHGQATGRFLLLGSASLDLLQQSSETLAGRISFLELSPFGLREVSSSRIEQERLWIRGGFPRSFLATDDEASLLWRQDFIRTYLERDIPQYGPRIPAETLRRFWTMLAHNQGQTLNAAQLAASLGVSGVTVARYLDLLVDLLLVRRLSPWLANVEKRLVRSPKVYIRDSGLVHALLGINNLDALLGHPVIGSSWEGLAIENIISHVPFGTEAGFYRTSAGAEIDLILSFPDDELWAVEIKLNSTPKPTRGFHTACDDLKPTKRFLVHPGQDTFPLDKNITAISLQDFLAQLQEKT